MPASTTMIWTAIAPQRAQVVSITPTWRFFYFASGRHCQDNLAMAADRPYAARMFPISYRRHRFPPTVIQHAVWLYLRFTLSYRDVEELLAQRALDPLRERP